MVLQRAQEAKLQAKKQFTREAAMLKDLTDTLENIKTAVVNKGGLTARLHRELEEVKNHKGVLDKVRTLAERRPRSHRGQPLVSMHPGGGGVGHRSPPS